MLVGDATGLIEAHHHYMWQYHLLSGRCYPRQIDAHLAIMGKAHYQLINDAVVSDGARQSLHLNVVRPVTDEMIAVEALHLGASGTSRQGRNMS